MGDLMGFEEAIRLGLEASESAVRRERRDQVSEIAREAATAVSSYLGKTALFRTVRYTVLGLDVDEEWYEVCDFHETPDRVFPITIRYAAVDVEAHDADALRAAFVNMFSSPHFGRILLKIKGP